MLTEFGDINIHATGTEIVIAFPYDLQGVYPLYHIVCVLAQQCEQISLFGRQLGRFAFYGQELFGQVEFEFPEKIDPGLLLVLRPVTALYRFNPSL